MSPAPHGDNENDKGPASDQEDNEVDNIHTPQFMIDADADSSDDNDDENDEGGILGYQMLPQDPMENDDTSDEEEEETDASSVADHQVSVDHPVLNQGEGAQLPNYMQVPELPKTDPKEILWNKQWPQVRSLGLEQEHVDQIKEAMVDITLPATNIPEWAKDISEQEWKDKLLKLQLGKTS